MSEMDDLTAFAMLVQANSFTLAAQWLDTSTSQLSKRISKLEKSFGVTLLHRTTRSLTLTSAGAILLPEARALLAQRDRVRDAMACLSESLVGCVRMTVPVSLGETFLEGLLDEFAARYPQLQMELDLNNQFCDMRRDGFDLGIRSSVGVDERLVAKPLLSLQELTCASPEYLAEHGTPHTPESLRVHRCLLNSHYAGRQTWVYHQSHELSRVNVRGTFASNHYGLLKKAALVGAGIARLPSYMVHNELNDGRLVWLLRDYQTPVSSLFLVHPFEGHLPRRIQVMADYLSEWFERSNAALQKL
ncbi:LysR family transcriptional regulator [Pseudomonas sp. LP_7_YM]|uniref:LysR family transcriptional regulator n=1 Tax=Pseudomonas sp. LP_7_YM TaxID=2485137 RepID=UPI00105D32B1|nr:LysR family transcriptional regulator [Pseudomonas sp. LP_7_YM]TDV70224.1 LysR family transcriptional regulator [Pseudomonas sp. LP_7_YM]